MPLIPSDVAGRLENSALAGLPKVAVSAPGWPADLVAIDIADLVVDVDDSQLFGRVLEIRDQARDAVGDLGWWPVIAEEEFSQLARYFQILPFEDPDTITADLGDPRWDLQDWLSSEIFVPEVSSVVWDIAHHRNPGPMVRSREEICAFLESLTTRGYAPLGACPTAEEIESAVDPDGEPLLSIGMTEWWLHRWAMAAIGESALVDAWRRAGSFFMLEYATLLLLPTSQPGAAGLLRSGPGEFAPSPHRHEAWACFVAHWQKRWGAELVSSGYLAAFNVERPPTTVEQAIPLAVEHYVFSDQMPRSGTSVYEYAYSLVGDTEWSLSVKP